MDKQKSAGLVVFLVVAVFSMPAVIMRGDNAICLRPLCLHPCQAGHSPFIREKSRSLPLSAC